MDATVMLETLSSRDHQAALAVIIQLAECRTRKRLSNILKTSVLPLIGCSGAFYAHLEGKDNTPRLLDNINVSTLCRCWWKDFYQIATQNHLLNHSIISDKTFSLATEAFCCIGKACSQCSACQSNILSHEYRNCTVVALFDSPNPTIALYFYRFSSQAPLYSQRDTKLLLLLRAVLLQTVNAIIYREQCYNLQQILNYLPDQREPLAVINELGFLVYKNTAFEKLVGQEKGKQILTRLMQKKSVKQAGESNAYLSQLGQRLYKVSLTAIKESVSESRRLSLLRLSRVIDKKLKIYRKLNKAGLSCRELEIATLIYQGGNKTSSHTCHPPTMFKDDILRDIDCSFF